MDKAASLPEGAAGRVGGPEELVVLPIYAALPPDQQMRVGGGRRFWGIFGGGGEGGGELVVLPMYAALPPDQQMRVGGRQRFVPVAACRRPACVHAARWRNLRLPQGRVVR
jgi:HrpA-like RNA helicase